MSINKRVLAFTSIRSDYDLMSELYQKIHVDSHLELGLIVSGAHMSSSYGYTIKYIREDHLPIIAEIESLLDSDSPGSRLKSASILLQNCMHNVISFNPDVILYAGDREDVMVGALIGAYLKIPTIHFFGGDHAVDGNVDNLVRHAASKLSSLHFVAHEQHKSRLIKIGEPDNRIFVIGSPALDKFVSTQHLDKQTVLNRMNCPQWEDYALVIFHPVLGYEELSGTYFANILQALMDLKIPAFISYPNVDAGNKQIIEVIEKNRENQQFVFYKNLERTLFVNVMRHARFMLGNSSAGLYEAPSIPLGVVNVGQRQKGRINAGNVLFVEEDVTSIRNGITEVLSEEFQVRLQEVKTIFGEGQSSNAALALIKDLDLRSFLFKTEDPLYE
jgi:GDP/UDP-N,N'-diacetylbacillosamine 2-epimerase (hydrolysing)